ncbi:hypothetical protein PIB30_036734 [Stylosanthes scabra]|uniref:Uncharacterized protein n=1 Tax=Stylosanthes scabra TaxID=79078 RepID=A0ABU6RE75_9FABA|nr:hypothetical protein [Stylosanthes scabra]
MIGPRGSMNDGCPALVLDRSGMAIITDRVWRSIRTENPWVGDSHSVYHQTFQGLGLVGEPKLRSASKLIKHVCDLVDRFWGVTRIPAVTRSDLLSLSSQALLPCYHGEPRTVKELQLC